MSHSFRIPIHGLSFSDLEQAVKEMGEPPYRAAQIWQWVYAHWAGEWSEMTNLPSGFRMRLADRFGLSPLRLMETEGAEGETRKLLFGLEDGERIESVIIPLKAAVTRGAREEGRRWNTVCVSSQVGCRYACAFCASGQAGFVRNLFGAEIVAQVVAAARVLSAVPERIVMMGIGEPLDNYEEVLRAIRIINDPRGLAIGARHITISTCGIVPGIERLSKEGLQVELSVSLHAPDDALRSRLMPVNRRYPLGMLLEACRRYDEATGRIITFEYTLIAGVNDAPAQAAKLVRLIRPLRGRVNLIPLSDVAGFGGRPTSRTAVAAFAEALKRGGVHVTLRASKGARLRAACGQLRIRRSTAGTDHGPKHSGTDHGEA